MNIINRILFGIEDKKEIKELQPLLYNENYFILFYSALVFVVLMFLPLVELLFIQEIRSNVFLYLRSFIICFAIFILTAVFAKKHPKMIVPLFYLLFIFNLFFNNYQK